MSSDLVKELRASADAIACVDRKVEVSPEDLVTIFRQAADELERLKLLVDIRSESWINTADALSEREAWLMDESARATRAEALAAEYKSALEFYADPANYALLSGSDYQMYASRTMIDHDDGDIARKALTEDTP